MLNLTTNTPEQTIAMGKQLAEFLKPGDVIALSGNLGAGKTTLVKGIAQGMGINEKKVNSPSYVLIREYKGKNIQLFHCDLYRLNNVEQISFLGIEDYFDREGVFVIEWAKRAGDLLPDEYLDINIDLLGEEKRGFRLKARGDKYQRLLNKFKNLIK
ncbi:MAG: tRNA (adenosine(37)-N6)-threonylcarbamoyltransferase complex ATPase subunit type 1 TsaE [Candidatus Omnitrophica bacterium]|nr:tRNA (adenosine(37)-N6)-threonylcarbamoyltransferase complex ATPase subunit type 1 TsaE [Candidatus Omnitrophota bacterium]